MPLWLRLPSAVALVTWGARTDRRWTVPVAAMLALPALWFGGASMLLAAVALASGRVRGRGAAAGARAGAPWGRRGGRSAPAIQDGLSRAPIRSTRSRGGRPPGRPRRGASRAARTSAAHDRGMMGAAQEAPVSSRLQGIRARPRRDHPRRRRVPASPCSAARSLGCAARGAARRLVRRQRHPGLAGPPPGRRVRSPGSSRADGRASGFVVLGVVLGLIAIPLVATAAGNPVPIDPSRA